MHFNLLKLHHSQSDIISLDKFIGKMDQILLSKRNKNKTKEIVECKIKRASFNGEISAGCK